MGNLACRPAADGGQGGLGGGVVIAELHRGGQVVAELGVGLLDEPGDVQVVYPPGQGQDHRQAQQGQFADEKSPEQGEPGRRRQTARDHVVAQDGDEQEDGQHGQYQQHRAADAEHADAPLGDADGIFEEQLALGMARAVGRGRVHNLCPRRRPVGASLLYYTDFSAHNQRLYMFLTSEKG